jgi:hypothetical protein
VLAILHEFRRAVAAVCRPAGSRLHPDDRPAERLSGDPPDVRPAALAGDAAGARRRQPLVRLAAGLGCWTSLLTLACTVPAAAWMLWRKPRLLASARFLALASVGFLLGALLWIAYHFRYRQKPFHDNYAVVPAHGVGVMLATGRRLLLRVLPATLAPDASPLPVRPPGFAAARPSARGYCRCDLRLPGGRAAGAPAPCQPCRDALGKPVRGCRGEAAPEGNSIASPAWNVLDQLIDECKCANS